MKEFVDSFTNYLFVLKNAQNGGNHEEKDSSAAFMCNNGSGSDGLQ